MSFMHTTNQLFFLSHFLFNRFTSVSVYVRSPYFVCCVCKRELFFFANGHFFLLYCRFLLLGNVVAFFYLCIVVGFSVITFFNDSYVNWGKFNGLSVEININYLCFCFIFFIYLFVFCSCMYVIALNTMHTMRIRYIICNRR